MTKKNNQFAFISDEVKREYLNKIIGFFRDQRNEEIGLIAAQDILDFFLLTIGEEMYKKAILDSKRLIKERFEDLEVELDVLSPDSFG